MCAAATTYADGNPRASAIIPVPVILTMVVARRYVIGGLVQGVGFRFFTEDVARREGIAGFVRNLEDGRVEAVAEGDAEAVARFERALHQGPAASRVEVIEVEPMPPSGRSVGFQIRV